MDSCSCCKAMIFLIVAVVIIPDLATSLKVSVKPTSEPIWFLEGDTLQLSCMVEGSKYVKPEWFRNELLVMGNGKEKLTESSESPKDTSSRPITKTTLTFKKADANIDDSGTYRCQAGSDDVMKRVDMFTVTARDVNLTLGFQTTLSCDIEPFYMKSSISWLKGQTPVDKVPELEGRFALGQFNKTVTITNSKTIDSSVYTCIIVFNPNTTMEQKFSRTLGIQGKPHIVSRPSSIENLKNVTNTSIILTCPATGYPAPEVFWQLGEDVIEASDRYVLSPANGVPDTRLEIKDPTEKDFTSYVCIAENSMGKSQITFNLKEDNNNSVGKISHSRITSSIVALLTTIFYCIL